MKSAVKRDAITAAEHSAAAWKKLDTARAALSVWLLSLPGNAIDADTVAALQVPLRGICELVSEAESTLGNASARRGDSLGLDLMFARGFAWMAEGALWSFMAQEVSEAPTPVDLAATARHVLACIAEFERTHRTASAPARAAEPAAAAGGVQHDRGGAIAGRYQLEPDDSGGAPAHS